MKRRFAISSLCYCLLLGSALSSFDPAEAGAARAVSSASGKTLILYDAASGAVPGSPLMGFTDFPPGAALPMFSNDATLMDTTTSGYATYAGWTANETITPGLPMLDRTIGFQVDFTLQIENESHINNDRSGISLILLSDDARGIELGFWENEIWVQSDTSTGGLFKHGEGISFPTTTGLIDYRLTILNETYTLTANTQSILSGPVRDYSEFDGFPDPYQTPNFLFLGDDTASAQARLRLRFLSITGTEPIMPAVTSTISNTSTPVATASPLPNPSLTPVPSPTPNDRVLDFCPSGWIFLAMTMASTLLGRKIRRDVTKQSRTSQAR